MIRFCSIIKASANTSVIGVIGIYSSTSCLQDPTFTSSALRIAGLAGGAGILLSTSTLSRLNGNRPLAAKPALIFFGMNAIFLAGLCREVKCSLLIVFTPPCSKSINLLAISCLE